MFRIEKKLQSGQKRKLKAGYTIEAAYLLPLIVFLIWNLLYLSFFLYDQSVMLQGSYCTALRTERLAGTVEEKRELAEKKYEHSVEKKIVCGSAKNEKNVTWGTVTVSTELNMYAPAGQFFQSIWKGKQKQSAQKWQPVTFIRNCRKTKGIWDWLQEERKR
ncbi:hypothetical protein V1224_15355 [Lachnospiraceae bacterium JLR.KK008]